MKLLVKCKCTDGEIGVDVRERNDDEDIRDYMNYVQLEIGIWHQYRGCSEQTLEYLKIPISDNKPVGVS